jgi:hypothetical protein
MKIKKIKNKERKREKDKTNDVLDNSDKNVSYIPKDNYSNMLKIPNSLNVDCQVNIPQNLMFKTFLKNKHFVIKSFKINRVFWITMMICVFVLSYKKGSCYVNNFCYVGFGIFSLIVVMLCGWKIHFWSHHMNAHDIYCDIMREFFHRHECDFNKYDRFMLNILLYVCDFHDKIHHDSSINKKWYNLIIEFLSNIYMEGGFLIILFYMFPNYPFNLKIFFLWACLYASVHVINYDYLHPQAHKEHHIDPRTNFGIDTLDILFNTKFKMNSIRDIENYNHASINLVLITCIMLFAFPN